MKLGLIIIIFIQIKRGFPAIEDQCIFLSQVESSSFLRKSDVDPFLKKANCLERDLETSFYRKMPTGIVEKTMSETTNTAETMGRQRKLKQSGFFRISLYRTRHPPPPCNSNPCQHGLCSNHGSAYSCACFAGWSGTRCNIEINECDSNPCLNGATCNDIVNGYWCDCEEDYTGNQCETDMCYPSQGADIAFIVDTSSSQGEDILQRQLDYIKTIVSTFPIGQDEFRFSLVSVSLSPVLHFDLDTHISNVSILNAIDNVNQTNGSSYLDTAIRMVRKDVFGNVTSTKAKYVITLFDGMYNDHKSTMNEVIQTKLDGLTLLSVGFGRQILHQALVDISTDYRYVFSSTTEDLIHWLSRRHAMDTCPDCSTQYSDIFVLFETSKNLGRSIFHQLLNTLTAIVEKIPLGQSRAHLSFATFDSTVTGIFDFVTYFNVIDAIKTTVKTELSHQTSNYTNALQYVKDNAFVPANGHRTGSRKILIIFMSELIPDIDTVKSQSEALKAENVTVMIVTTSPHAAPDLTHVQEIVSDPAFLFVLGMKIYGSATAVYTLSTMFEYSLCIFD